MGQDRIFYCLMINNFRKEVKRELRLENESVFVKGAQFYRANNSLERMARRAVKTGKKGEKNKFKKNQKNLKKGVDKTK